MNLIITDKCTNSCPYCFAAYEMQKHNEQNVLSKENIDVFLDFLDKGDTSFRLNIIGGEPLIYPHFDYLLEKLYNSKKVSHMVFFTGGIVSKKNIAAISKCEEKASLLFNLNERRSYMNPKHHNQVVDNLEFAMRCGIRSSIGYNIYRQDFNGDEIINYCRDFGIKDLRFAVACPVYEVASNMVVPFSGYGELSTKVFSFLEKCFVNGIKGHLDCTLPLCFFSTDQLGNLAKMHPQIISRMGKCGIPIDVNYDLSLFRCFSFSSYFSRKLTDFSSVEEIRNYFEEIIDSRLLRPIIKDDCKECRYSDCCNGGCLSNNRQFMNNPSKNDIVANIYSLIEENKIDQAIKKFEIIRNMTSPDKFLLAHLYYLRNDYTYALKLVREAITTSKSAAMLQGAKVLQNTILSKMGNL